MIKVDFIQVPYDSGHRGLRMGAGPLVLVGSGLPDHLAGNGHDVRIVPVEMECEFPTEIAAAFELAAAIRNRVTESSSHGRFPIVLAGNCIAALGVAASLSLVDVYWFDAHGDLNTPESTKSGFLDGMALSILLGRCWTGLAGEVGVPVIPPDRVWLIGARDLDPGERDYLDRAAIHVAGTDLTLGHPPEGPSARRAYLHIDLDVLDPAEGRVNAFQTAGGIEVGQLMAVIDRIRERSPLGALALTAYDPAGDPDGSVVEAARRIVDHVVGAGNGPSGT